MMSTASARKRVALITGAGKGIGLEAARALSLSGRFVILVDRVPIDAAELGFTNAEALAFRGDVTDQGFMIRLHQQINELAGPVAILVNNAGISPKRTDGRSHGILDLPLAEWNSVLNVNLTAVMLACQLFLPDMQKLGFGRIVNLSSLAGRSKSVVAGPSYMASKAGLLGLTRAIATEMGCFGITANCVAPGRILTEMAMQAGEEINRRYAEQIPVKRIGEPSEVARAISFLCEDGSGFINGATIDINGGFFMS